MLSNTNILHLLEALGCGRLILDTKGRVLQTNEKAQRYLGTQLDISRRGGARVGPLDQVEVGLREALKTSLNIMPILGEHIIVPRENGRPLLLRSVALPGEKETEQFTALIVLDLEDCPYPDEKLLRELFLLTPAECRLASRLCCGEALDSIAKDLNVGRGTLRGHLKALFWKTGTRRQGELIALLAHLSRLHPDFHSRSRLES